MAISNPLLLGIGVIPPLAMFATPRPGTLMFLGLAIIGIGVLRHKGVL